MSHSSLKPASPASFGVTMSSPEPTIDAVRMRPGPMCRRITSQWVGASRGEESDSGIAGVYRKIRRGSKQLKMALGSLQTSSTPRLRTEARPFRSQAPYSGNQRLAQFNHRSGIGIVIHHIGKGILLARDADDI